MEPDEPRWPHRKGDLLKRLGRPGAAVEAYEQAVDLYAQKGFVARAAAMAKVVVAISPERADVLKRVSSDAARKLHRASRSRVITADETTAQGKRLADDAPPLVEDASAAADIRRFTLPPAARGRRLELHISDAEVQDPPPLAEDGSAERPTAKRLAELTSMPLFAEVPQSILGRIVQESRLVDLDPGEKLFDRGTGANALFTLVEGSIQLMGQAEEDSIILSEGDVVGISSLLKHVRYERDAVARSKVRALRISTLLLDQLVGEYPALHDVLLEVLGRRLVSTLLRTSPMFSSFGASARAALAATFEVRRANRGTTIVEAGKHVDGLYIPMIGELTAFGPAGERMGRLKLGQALGDQAMLTRTPSQFTVKAASDVLLLRMPADRFHGLVSQHPKIVAHLEKLALRPTPRRLLLLTDEKTDP